jgi:hypothetical protein
MPSSETLQILEFHCFVVAFLVVATNTISSTVQTLLGRSNEEIGGTCDTYGGDRNVQRVSQEKPKEKRLLTDLGVNGKNIGYVCYLQLG